MSPRLKSTCFLLFTVAVALVGCGREPAERPERIVLVTIDTLRADHVGAYGYEHAHTPTLDGLAKRGTLFETALAPVPLTLPSHTTLFTGLDPPRHGVRHNAYYRLSEAIPTLTERLTESGRAGAAFVGAVVLHPRYGLARGFDTYDFDSERLAAGHGGYAERTAEAVADSALAWLDDAPPRFFLWLHFYDPHAAYDPPPGFRLTARTQYDGEIAYADTQLGRVLTAIDEHFGPEGTLVVATSDHGEALGEHGEPTHSYGIYEATQRIPWILAGPGVPVGRRIHAPVRLTDLAPTVLSLAGAEPLADIDGRDLGPWLSSGEPPSDASIYMETVATQFDHGWSPLFALRRDRWKFIQAPRPELYDLDEDPDERSNLVDREAERARELTADLEALRGRPPLVQADTVEPNAEERLQLESLGYVASKATDAMSFEVVGKDPKDGAATLEALAEATRLRNAGQALEAYALLEPFEGQGISFLHRRLHAALQAGLHSAAEKDARAAIALEPSRAVSHDLLGAALEVQGRTREAHEAYSRSLELEGDRASATLGRARTAEVLGELDAAKRDYRAVRVLDPGLAEPVWRLAALEIEAGAPAAADALLEELSDDERGKPKAALRLALAEQQAGDSDGALERLSDAHSRSPDDETLARYTAHLLESSGQHEALLQLAESFLEHQPDAAWAQNAAAWSMATLDRDLDRALALATAAFETLGPLPAVLDTVATVHLARGELKAALARADEALDAGADDGERDVDADGHELDARLHFLRAKALTELGRTGDAQQALSRSLEADPATGEAKWTAERRALAQRLGVEVL